MADKEQWLDRDRIKGVLENVEAIASLLDTIPHGIAKQINRQLEGIEGVLTDDIGAIMGQCESCEAMITTEDESATGEDGCRFCPDCVASWNEPIVSVVGGTDCR